MIVAQFSTMDYSGGAGRAAHRLHKALQRSGCRSLMFCIHRARTDDPSILKVLPRKDTLCTTQQAMYEMLHGALQGDYINSNRTDLSQTLFSLGNPGFDLTDLWQVQYARILHLHWITYFLSPESVRRLGATGIPMVWTLHDQWPMTGGCHYDAGCGGYEDACRGCPQLVDDPYGLPAALLEDKLALWADLNITIVTPSRWMADRVRRSRVFRHHRVEVIPNGLDTTIYCPTDKSAIRRELGLPGDALVLGFGARSLADRRKGLGILIKALRIARTEPRWPSNVHLLLIGESDVDLSDLALPVHNCGKVEADIQMARILNAADAVVLPSLEDNYPNVMVEAMSCGIPVIAFDVGGMKDAVVDGVNGILVTPPGDEWAMARAIHVFAASPEKAIALGRAAREKISPSHSLSTFADRMLELYEDLAPGFWAPLPDQVFAQLGALKESEKPRSFSCGPLHSLGPGFAKPEMLSWLARLVDAQRERVRTLAEQSRR
jgi:glycosyltransferase involved in cell wall biosynthesis